MAGFLVTIDGPAGSGKSTVARCLAQKIGAAFLDTGAMYRAVTWAAVQEGVNLNDDAQLERVIDNHSFDFQVLGDTTMVTVDGVDITGQIRTVELTANVRYVAASAAARARLVQMQRQFAQGHDRVVTEGRDQGTVAFPEADVKIFLVADAAERARRRKIELDAQGTRTDVSELQKAIEARDKSDEDRSVGPLKPAVDAVLIDTTKLGIEDVVDRVVRLIEEKCSQRG